jgi:hypothetical protein
MHHDAAKDLWSIELKVPRHMAPVTLGFVLWNSGALTHIHTVLMGERGISFRGERQGVCVCIALPHALALLRAMNMAPVTLGFVLWSSGALAHAV